MRSNGICININNCTHIVNILINQKPLTQEIMEFLRASQCGFDGRIPKICCSDQVSLYILLIQINKISFKFIRSPECLGKIILPN